MQWITRRKWTNKQPPKGLSKAEVKKKVWFLSCFLFCFVFLLMALWASIWEGNNAWVRKSSKWFNTCGFIPILPPPHPLPLPPGASWNESLLLRHPKFRTCPTFDHFTQNASLIQQDHMEFHNWMYRTQFFSLSFLKEVNTFLKEINIFHQL